MKQFPALILVFVLLPLLVVPQVNPDNILDTVETVEGPVILYKNFSWEFLGAEPVMLNIEADSSGLFSEGWTTDQVRCLGYMKPDSIQDTVLILTSEEMKFCMPVPVEHLIRGFMYTHKGLDIRLKMGDTVRAAFDGVVRYARSNRGGFGNLIILRHYNGLETFYAHLSKLKVTVNQVVKAGDPVGFGGSTGRSRGPHLHFEIRYRDVPVDPRRVIDLDSCMLVANVFPIRKEVFYPHDWDFTAVYHKIKSGDTLGHLAVKYHTSVKEICAMNNIRSTTTLRIGRVLRVR
ncbi:MAG: LysM peptidoglycan-binding domain-containing protein [Bacteroidetes bacterium]|nr:MAG: LysM peptidoglycan-binding domain-containing protein [Bacteroidota bacterium]